MKRFFFYVTLLLILLISASCSEKEIKQKVFEDKSKIIAKVNTSVLTENEFKSYYTEEEWKALSLADKREFVKKWIDVTVLSLKADQEKISENFRTKNKLKAAEKKIKANELISKKMKEVKIKEENLFSYYKAHKVKYSKKIRNLKIQMIYVRNKEDYRKVLGELNKNKKMSDVAKEYSQLPSGRNGGFLGWHTKKDFNKELWNELIKLKQYQFKIVKLDDGYYFVNWYKEKFTKNYLPFSQVKDEIRNTIIKQREKEIYDKTLKEIKKEFETSISI